MADKPNPITREEFDNFVRRCNEGMGKLPPKPLILVHPRDLEAAKRFFGVE